MKQPDFRALLDMLKEELDTTVNTLREKGARPFSRPLAVAVLFIGTAYQFLWVPSVAKMSKVKKREVAVRAVLLHADRYSSLNARINALCARLPAVKDRDQWLMNSLMDSMRSEAIVSDAIRPAVEDEVSGLLYQNITINLSLKFAEVYSWARKLETAKPWLHVAILEVNKLAEPIGSAQVTAMVGTIIPKTRAGQ